MFDSITFTVIFGVVGILIAYDIWTIVKRGVETSISVQLHKFSKEHPIIPFALGIVFGHFFWPVV